MILYPKNIFRFIRSVHVHLKTDNVDYLKKPSWFFFFFNFFAIHSSSIHEKRCQMFVKLFCLFQCSRNQQWEASTFIHSVKHQHSKYFDSLLSSKMIPQNWTSFMHVPLLFEQCSDVKNMVVPWFLSHLVLGLTILEFES